MGLCCGRSPVLERLERQTRNSSCPKFLLPLIRLTLNSFLPTIPFAPGKSPVLERLERQTPNSSCPFSVFVLIGNLWRQAGQPKFWILSLNSICIWYIAESNLCLVYIYIYIFICIYIGIYIQIYVHIGIHIHIYVWLYIHVYIYMYMYVWYTYLYIYLFVYIFGTHVTYMYVYICIYIQVYSFLILGQIYWQQQRRIYGLLDALDSHTSEVH